jgi:DNA-binding MarR family transcriptional regulator
VRELAEAADIASPTATRTLDGLERDGIVTRRPSQTDRRSVIVELTERGREMMLASRKRMRAARAELYARLDSSEQEEAERILRRLTEIIRSI